MVTLVLAVLLLSAAALALACTAGFATELIIGNRDKPDRNVGALASGVTFFVAVMCLCLYGFFMVVA